MNTLTKRYYDTTNPCTVCHAKPGERCVNYSDGGPDHVKGADREFPHALGGRTWDSSWSAGYAAALADEATKEDR